MNNMSRGQILLKESLQSEYSSLVYNTIIWANSFISVIKFEDYAEKMNYDMRRDYSKIRLSIENRLNFIKFNLTDKRINIFNNKDNFKLQEGGAMYFMIDKKIFINEMSYLLDTEFSHEGYTYNDYFILELAQISHTLSALFMNNSLKKLFEKNLVPDFHKEITTGGGFCQFAIMGLNASKLLKTIDIQEIFNLN